MWTCGYKWDGVRMFIYYAPSLSARSSLYNTCIYDMWLERRRTHCFRIAPWYSDYGLPRSRSNSSSIRSLAQSMSRRSNLMAKNGKHLYDRSQADTTTNTNARHGATSSAANSENPRLWTIRRVVDAFWSRCGAEGRASSESQWHTVFDCSKPNHSVNIRNGWIFFCNAKVKAGHIWNTLPGSWYGVFFLFSFV